MSLLPVLELCVQLDSFRNIDLFQQGLYRIRLEVRSLEFEGLPYDISLKLCPKPGDLHSFDPAKLCSTFAESRSFLLRFCNEEVQLKESFYFNLKIHKNESFTLKYSLLFNDLKGKVKPEDLSDFLPSSLNYETISEFELVLEFPSTFKSFFVPAAFSKHISLISSTIHYTVVDYTVKTQLFNGISLFRDRTGSAREYIGSAETDKIYQSFMYLLVHNYHTLSDYYLQVMGKCINQEMRMSLEHRCFPSGLNLPGINSVNSFSHRVASHKPEKIANDLINELHHVGTQILVLWKKTLELINKNTKTILSLLRDQHNVEMRSILSKAVIRKVMRFNDFSVVQEDSSSVNHSFAEIRRKENLKKYSNFLTFCTKPSDPVIIDELFLSDTDEHIQSNNFSNIFGRTRKRNSELHLVVMVHGYQGSPKDLLILRNEISIMFPNTIFLLSNSNENQTENSIIELGKNLADEVKRFISENNITSIGNLSFIGHSLGGLIIRSALPMLLEFSSNFHLLMTISSPHLGVLEASKLVRAGIWIVSSVTKAVSLSELRLSDCKNIENTTLFKLAASTGPEIFTHFVLISSPQDSYSPHFSSRIEVNKKISKNHRFYVNMAKHLVNPRRKLNRIDVDFKIQHNNFDAWIGRAGHVEFLENRYFMKFLMYLHPEFFE